MEWRHPPLPLAHLAPPNSGPSNTAKIYIPLAFNLFPNARPSIAHPLSDHSREGVGRLPAGRPLPGRFLSFAVCTRLKTRHKIRKSRNEGNSRNGAISRNEGNSGNDAISRNEGNSRNEAFSRNEGNRRNEGNGPNQGCHPSPKPESQAGVPGHGSALEASRKLAPSAMTDLSHHEYTRTPEDRRSLPKDAGAPPPAPRRRQASGLPPRTLPRRSPALDKIANA